MTVNINWDNLSFSLTPTKYMYVENTFEGEWKNDKEHGYGILTLVNLGI